MIQYYLTVEQVIQFRDLASAYCKQHNIFNENIDDDIMSYLEHNFKNIIYQYNPDYCIYAKSEKDITIFLLKL